MDRRYCTGVRNGTKYEFRVAALNAVGTGAESSSIDSTPFVFQPSALEASIPLVGKTISVGDHVKFSATELPVGSSVTIQLDSPVVTLATVTTGSDGVLNADVLIPANTAAGAHHLTLTLSGTGADPVTTSYAFTVAPVTPAAATNAVAQQAATLAFTGGRLTLAVPIGGALAVLIGIGAFLLAASRRRRT